MKTNYIFLIVTGFILVIAAITNPKEEEHKAEVKKLLMQNLTKTMGNDLTSGNNFEVAGKALGYSLGMNLFDRMLDNVISVPNFVFFSLTKITYGSDEKIIGLGAFGNVWLFADEIDRSNITR